MPIPFLSEPENRILIDTYAEKTNAEAEYPISIKSPYFKILSLSLDQLQSIQTNKIYFLPPSETIYVI